MFWSKNKNKIGIPLHTQVLLYKNGFKGAYIIRTCFRVCLLQDQLRKVAVVSRFLDFHELFRRDCEATSVVAAADIMFCQSSCYLE